MRRRRRVEPQINMAPLVDIVFQLLIFFVFTAGMVSEPMGIEVDLPGSTTADSPYTKSLMVFVTAEGEIFVGEEAVLLSQLRRVLLQKIGDGEVPGLTIYADEEVSWQRVLRVMDAARSVGVSQLDFAVENLEDL
ncbi:MAG: biopolymer transporter ExbD [Firmicutes bacterium]|nr:biopolymer transporter ExbD [Bacillota bacterium]